MLCYKQGVAGSNPVGPTNILPGYPIVGMDGTENPRKVVRLHPLALKHLEA